jgi:hypothetical protein
MGALGDIASTTSDPAIRTRFGQRMIDGWAGRLQDFDSETSAAHVSSQFAQP